MNNFTPLAPNAIPTFGTSGDAVTKLQTAYNQANPNTPIKVDGLYGTETQNALNKAPLPTSTTTTPTTTPTPTPTNTISTPATGIPTGTPTSTDIANAETSAFSTPSKTSQQTYQDAYNASGLGTLKSNIDTLNQSIADKQQKLTEALGTINENPFLDEKTRIGRGKNITDIANAEISNLNSQVKNASDLYSQGLNEVNGVVTRNQNDFSTNEKINSDKLSFLQHQAEQSIADAKANKTAPSVIGDASVGFYRWDPTLQKFIQTIAPKPVSTTATTLPQAEYNRTATSEMATHLQSISDQNGKLTPAQYKSAKSQWVAQSGLSSALFDQTFGNMAYITSGNNGSPYSADDYGIPLTTASTLGQ